MSKYISPLEETAPENIPLKTPPLSRTLPITSSSVQPLHHTSEYRTQFYTPSQLSSSVSQMQLFSQNSPSSPLVTPTTFSRTAPIGSPSVQSLSTYATINDFTSYQAKSVRDLLKKKNDAIISRDRKLQSLQDSADSLKRALEEKNNTIDVSFARLSIFTAILSFLCFPLNFLLATEKTTFRCED